MLNSPQTSAFDAMPKVLSHLYPVQEKEMLDSGLVDRTPEIRSRELFPTLYHRLPICKLM